MTHDDPQPISPPQPVTPDPWAALASRSPSRLALGRAGSALPTREVLNLALAHARARDAVHDVFDGDRLAVAAEAMGLAVARIESAAPDRATYLRRPDFGRRLSRRSRAALEALERPTCDVALVIADGLSATAVAENAAEVMQALVIHLRGMGLRLAPLAIATQARVALGDEAGQILGARLVVVLIGERPGLSAADSLGAYITYEPRVGRTDAQRNCISNIRSAGLPPAEAAAKIAWLVQQALERSLTGVALKDESDALPAATPVAAGLRDAAVAGRQ